MKRYGLGLVTIEFLLILAIVFLLIALVMITMCYNMRIIQTYSWVDYPIRVRCEIVRMYADTRRLTTGISYLC